MRECEINLIPADIIAREAFQERVKSWIFLAVGGLLFLIAVSISIKAANNSISKEIATLATRSEKLSKEMVEIKEVDIREKELLNIKDKIHYISQRGPMIEIFAAIDRSINDSITLTHFEINYNFPYILIANKENSIGTGYFNSNISAKTMTGQKMGKNSIILQGAASTNTDLAAMLKQLSGDPLFQTINLKYARAGESEKSKTITFEVEGTLTDKIGGKGQ